ncbi:MAG: hypothetical protein IJ111_13030 [Eggerthellaceae bacterium]|nr:hypothetical protein [Eggerthellaceae bacterium]
MPVTDEQARALGRRLLAARGRILAEHGFYGLLLMHMKFAVGDELDTAWVSRDTITFNPDFSDKLNADELCFVLEHEVLHAALGHLERVGARDPELWNLACDIVVNSNIKHSNGDDPASITLRCEPGESFHLAPNGKEGWHYTADEVYEMLLKKRRKKGGAGEPKRGSGADDPGMSGGDAIGTARAIGRRGRWDWHIPDDGSDPQAEAEAHDAWAQRLADAKESMRARDPSNGRGLAPACIERRLDELQGAQADWRLLLGEFVQEEVCDYTFSSPDRRFPDSPFVLPGFSDTEAVAHDVLFMADASGSVSSAALTAAFSEVRGAMEQFNGKLDGWLGFFDAVPYEPVRFESVEDLLAIRPKGGGGTRFEAVFECVERWLCAEDLSCIVVLTDGYAPVPDESAAKGVPVLWLIDGDGPAPRWGKVARVPDAR